MTRMPSIVGIALDSNTDRIFSHVGDLTEVRKWAAEIATPNIRVQICEIGEIVMFAGAATS